CNLVHQSGVLGTDLDGQRAVDTGTSQASAARRLGGRGVVAIASLKGRLQVVAVGLLDIGTVLRTELSDQRVIRCGEQSGAALIGGGKVAVATLQRQSIVGVAIGKETATNRALGGERNVLLTELQRGLVIGSAIAR